MSSILQAERQPLLLLLLEGDGVNWQCSSGVGASSSIELTPILRRLFSSWIFKKLAMGCMCRWFQQFACEM